MDERLPPPSRAGEEEEFGDEMAVSEELLSNNVLGYRPGDSTSPNLIEVK